MFEPPRRGIFAPKCSNILDPHATIARTVCIPRNRMPKQSQLQLRAFGAHLQRYILLKPIHAKAMRRSSRCGQRQWKGEIYEWINLMLRRTLSSPSRANDAGKTMQTWVLVPPDVVDVQPSVFRAKRQTIEKTGRATSGRFQTAQPHPSCHCPSFALP